MDSKQASVIVGGQWNNLLIANWFDKEWFENEFHLKLTEKQYKEIVELYNDSNMPDIITQEIRDWAIDNAIVEEFREK